MAENTQGGSGGDVLTNTTTSTSGSRGRSAAGAGESATNTTVSSSGGRAGAGAGDGVSSATSKDANLEDLASEQNPAEATKAPRRKFVKTGTIPAAAPPLPHSAHGEMVTGYYVSELGGLPSEALEKDPLENPYISDEHAAGRADQVLRMASVLQQSKIQENRLRAIEEGGESEGVKIKLKKAHEHNRVRYEAGDEVVVDEGSAKFIEDNKIGSRV